MNNVNPVPPQNNPVPAQNNPEPLIPRSDNNPFLQRTQAPVISEQIKTNKVKNSSEVSNKLWIIFLVLFSIIIGFWIGYFTNDYFYQSAQDKCAVPTPPISNQVEFLPSPTPEPIMIEKNYINFRGVESYINDGLDFSSEQQCVENEIVTLTAIEDDFITIKINQWTVSEDSGESVAQLIDFQVRNQECLPVKSLCSDISIERCFSLENINGVYHLDYNFIESALLDQTEEIEAET